MMTAWAAKGLGLLPFDMDPGSIPGTVIQIEIMDLPKEGEIGITKLLGKCLAYGYPAPVAPSKGVA